MPRVSKRKRMSHAEFAIEPRDAVTASDPAKVMDELSPVFPETELAGLVPRIRAASVRIAGRLETREK